MPLEAPRLPPLRCLCEQPKDPLTEAPSGDYASPGQILRDTAAPLPGSPGG